MTARILSGSSAVTAPRRERPHLGASHWWWVGMAGHVRSSRQPVTLAAPQSATRPIGCVYRLVFAGSRWDIRAPRLPDTRPPSGMALFADGRSDTSAQRPGDSRLFSDVCLSADPRPDVCTLRLNDIRAVPNRPLPACAGAASAPYVPREVPGGGRGIRVAADARSEHRVRHLADTRPSKPVCMSASTRTLRVRVHPLNALATTPASGPPFARNACIEDGLSAPNRCIQDGFFAHEVCLSTTHDPVRACKRSAGPRSAPKSCAAARRGCRSKHDRRRRARCEKSAHNLYGASKARRAARHISRKG
jgi:hypothetical protein